MVPPRLPQSPSLHHCVACGSGPPGQVASPHNLGCSGNVFLSTTSTMHRAILVVGPPGEFLLARDFDGKVP